MARLFLALELPDELAAQLLPLQTALPPSCRRVPRANLHITLVFIGSADLALASELLAGYNWVAAVQQPSFSVGLSALGYFKNKRETVFWMGVQNGFPLERLRARLLTALTPLGLESTSHDFRPHITLGRCRGAVAASSIQRFMAQPQANQLSGFSVNHFALYSSEPRAEGPVYKIEGRYEFARVP